MVALPLIGMAFISLDAARFHWSSMPVWMQVVGALILLGSFYILFQTFRENSYLASVVRIQDERGQTVISTEPYAYVRHPMYGGIVIFMLGMCLLLGSWYGLLFRGAVYGITGEAGSAGGTNIAGGAAWLCGLYGECEIPACPVYLVEMNRPISGSGDGSNSKHVRPLRCVKFAGPTPDSRPGAGKRRLLGNCGSALPSGNSLSPFFVKALAKLAGSILSR